MQRLLLGVGLADPATATIAANARTDRLKTDFIASLPMQPSGCVCYLFWTFREENFLASHCGLCDHNRVLTNFFVGKEGSRRPKYFEALA